MKEYTEEKIFENYPCAKVTGVYHITVNHADTLCGENYFNGGLARMRMLRGKGRYNQKYVQHLKYLWWHEVACDKCRELSKNIPHHKLPNKD